MNNPATNVRGLPDLCNFMSSDKVFAVFRRFDNLAIRNLLCLQSELSQLEDRLAQLDSEDQLSGSQDRIKNLHSWPDDQNEERKQIIADVRVKLQIYRKFCLR